MNQLYIYSNSRFCYRKLLKISVRLENESASGLGNLELVIGFLLERLADSK